MTDSSPEISEARMRAALFLPSSHASMHRPRRRFVQDGEVPVVMTARQARQPDERSHLAQLQQVVAQLRRELDAEREARLAAERNLLRVEETNRQLQTRLAHNEIARREYARPAPPPVMPATPVSADAMAPKKRGRKPMLRAASAIPMQTEESRPTATRPLEEPPRDAPCDARPDGAQPGDSGGEGFVEWWKPDWQQAFR